MAENNTCKEHQMLRQEIEDLKETVKNNRPLIEGKVGSKQMWTIISVFLVMAMAVVGFLWNEQRSVRLRLEDYQDKLTGRQGVLTIMDKKLDRLDLVLTYHLTETGKSLPYIEKK